MLQTIEKILLNKWLLAIATIIGAMGLFLEPKIIASLLSIISTEAEIWRYFPSPSPRGLLYAHKFVTC